VFCSKSGCKDQIASYPPLVHNIHIKQKFKSNKFYKIQWPEIMHLEVKLKIIFENRDNFGCGDCFNQKINLKKSKQFDLTQQHSIYPDYIQQTTPLASKVIEYFHDNHCKYIQKLLRIQQDFNMEKNRSVRANNNKRNPIFYKVRKRLYHLDVTKTNSWSYKKYKLRFVSVFYL